MPPMSFNGIVTKAGFMNRTVTVTVSRWVVHQLTGKRIIRSKKYLVHDANNQLRTEDVVQIRNCPPISARKRFTLERIIRSPEAERAALENRSKEPIRPGGVLDALANQQASSSATL